MMSKKKSKKQPKVKFCENDGGLGIDPCEGISEVAVVELSVDMEFTGLDRPTIHLCEVCADRLKEHAESLGYDVEEV